MFVAGIVAAVIGIILFHTALGKTLRANSDVRIPFGRSPERSPRGSIPMRALGAGLIVLGAVFVSTAGWHWTLIVLSAGPVAALIVLVVHNLRVRRGGGSRAV